MANVNVGGIAIGPAEPVRIIAELGICHQGNLDLAKEMVWVSAQARADFIKFEIYQLDTALSKPYRKNATISYETAHGSVTENLFEAFKKGHLSFEQGRELISEIRKTRIPFFATACSVEEVDFLHQEGACAVKLSSGEIDHYPLIHYVAKLQMPLFIDTAKTFLWEIVRAVEEFFMHGGKDIIVMINPPGYPAPPDTIDLKRIAAIMDFLKVPVGFSCHSPGRNVIMAAIGFGACIIEKPISPDKTLPCIEYLFSENMTDYKDFIDSITYISKARGQVGRIWLRNEMQEQLLHRHSIVAKHSLRRGHQLTQNDICIARPGFGIRPEYINLVINRTLKRDFNEGEVITWDDI